MGKSGLLFSISVIEEKEGRGTNEIKFAELVVRAFCLVTSCLPVKSWARPGTLRDGREKRKVIVGGGEGMKQHQQDRRVLPYRTVVVRSSRSTVN